ncbi:MAG TPA: hypothetical protein VF025_09455 [Gaiellaceae bacterium]
MSELDPEKVAHLQDLTTLFGLEIPAEALAAAGITPAEYATWRMDLADEEQRLWDLLAPPTTSRRRIATRCRRGEHPKRSPSSSGASGGAAATKSSAARPSGKSDRRPPSSGQPPLDVSRKDVDDDLATRTCQDIEGCTEARLAYGFLLGVDFLGQRLCQSRGQPFAGRP